MLFRLYLECFRSSPTVSHRLKPILTTLYMTIITKQKNFEINSQVTNRMASCETVSCSVQRCQTVPKPTVSGRLTLIYNRDSPSVTVTYQNVFHLGCGSYKPSLRSDFRSKTKFHKRFPTEGLA